VCERFIKAKSMRQHRKSDPDLSQRDASHVLQGYHSAMQAGKGLVSYLLLVTTLSVSMLFSGLILE
jgi:hypothetical protein